ncbi:putative mitochondrial protein AtMg00310 [Apium graveolens]|uniref:putative mitochondrial protein AtMg00310 n=1 Tax=Apium graveolens TaxID=4045 RepID=UPI003D7B0981
MNKNLSKGGIATLLKSAAQTIPNFWMSIFLIPNGISETIEKLMNGFWWGRGVNGKGISWMAWDKMCAPKSHGGMGMKNLKNFNMAMLAKQGWRILNKENPLVSAIMKARYFPNSEFLDAEVGANPSFVWRSIVSAQEAIKAGCRRKIGNGVSTKVWDVPWLPDSENGFMSTYKPAQLQNVTVDSLMDIEKKRWDFEVIRDICNDRDLRLI